MSRADDARGILATPLIMEILKDFEDSAINGVLAAKFNDHETRQSNAAEARAVRNLIARLESIACEDQPAPVRKAPA